MMLMGSENSPQKASEAVEKDAIAGAKDEVAMEAQSALLDYFNKKYVERNDTDGASTQSEVAKAVGKAVDSAKSKNKQLLSDSGVTDNTITLKTKSYTVKGTIDENGGITWRDIVASTGGELDKEIDKTAELKIGDYVEYGVTYSDIYIDHVYNTENGWRVLDPGTRNDDGTYSGVKLISTGIPVGINLENSINNNNSWWGTKEDLKDIYGNLADEIDTKENADYYYMAAGLRKHFEKILFVSKEDNEHTGYYKKINDKYTEEITGVIFKTEKAKEVHSLTLEEFYHACGDVGRPENLKVDAAEGLFNLGDYAGLGYYKDTDIDSERWFYYLADPFGNNLNYVSFSYDNAGNLNYGSPLKAVRDKSRNIYRL